MTLVNISSRLGAAVAATIAATAVAASSAQADLSSDCQTTLSGDPLCAVYAVHPELVSPALQSGLQAAAAELAATPLGSLADNIPAVPAPTVSTGVFSGDGAGTPPLPAGIFVRDGTAWTGTPALGPLTSVWAGASAVTTNLGMVVVATFSADGATLQTVKAITAPSAHGNLTITNALGSTLLLKAADGTTWTFDPSVGQIR